MQLPATQTLADEVARVTEQQVYQRAVFFVRPLGFIEPTAARQISYHDSLAFQAVHEEIYRDHGFAIVDVPLAGVADRAAAIESYVANH